MDLPEEQTQEYSPAQVKLLSILQLKRTSRILKKLTVTERELIAQKCLSVPVSFFKNNAPLHENLDSFRGMGQTGNLNAVELHGQEESAFGSSQAVGGGKQCAEENVVHSGQKADDEDIHNYFILKELNVQLEVVDGFVELKRQGYIWCKHPYRKLGIISVLGNEGFMVYYGEDFITDQAVAVVVKTSSYEDACQLATSLKTKAKTRTYSDSSLSPTSPKKPPRKSPWSPSKIKELKDSAKMNERPGQLDLLENIDSQCQFYVPSVLMNERKSRADIEGYKFPLKPRSEDSKLSNESLTASAKENIESENIKDETIVGTLSLVDTEPTLGSQQPLVTSEDFNMKFMVEMQAKFQLKFQEKLYKFSPNKNKKMLESEMKRQLQNFIKYEEDYTDSLKEVITLDGAGNEILRSVITSANKVSEVQDILQGTYDSRMKLISILETFLDNSTVFEESYLKYSRNLRKLRKSGTIEDISYFVRSKLDQIDERCRYYEDTFFIWKSYFSKESELQKFKQIADFFKEMSRNLKHFLVLDSIEDLPMNLDKYIPVEISESCYIEGANFSHKELYGVLILRDELLVIVRKVSETANEFCDCFRIEQIKMEREDSTGFLSLEVNYGKRRGKEIIVLKNFEIGGARKMADRIEQIKNKAKD